MKNSSPSRQSTRNLSITVVRHPVRKRVGVWGARILPWLLPPIGTDGTDGNAPGMENLYIGTIL